MKLYITRSLKGRVIAYLVTIVGCYLCLCCILLLTQNKLLFPVPDVGYSEELEGFTRFDHQGRTYVCQLDVPDDAQAIIVYFHGNAVDIGWAQVRQRYFKSLSKEFRIGICMLEFPGYGLGPGSATPGAFIAACDAVVAYLQQRFDKDLIFYGRSLGSGIAAYAAHRYPSNGVILESAYRSAQRVLLPVCIFPWDFFNTQSIIADIDVPCLFIHGQQDRVIAFSHGVYLAAHCQHLQAHCWLPEHGHNDIILNQMPTDDYIRSFFKDLGLARGAQ